MKNKYCKRSRLTEYQFRLLLRYFCDDLDTIKTARRVGLSRESVTQYFGKIRERITSLAETDEKLSGEVEVDESYFGPRRVRGKRGRGAARKIPVIGLLKRNGSVYTKVVTKCSKEQLMPVIKGKILEGSTIHIDGWTSYDGLILNGYKHYRIYHSKNEFARGKSHINGIESFWSFTKRRMARQNGVRKNKFMIHLKESEYRWNNRKSNMYTTLLKELRSNPLEL